MARRTAHKKNPLLCPLHEFTLHSQDRIGTALHVGFGLSTAVIPLRIIP